MAAGVAVLKEQDPGERSLDGRVLELARAGDAEALRVIYEAHGAAILGTALRLTASTQDAEDILQDLFVGLPEALRSFRGDGSLEGWLRRIAARLALQRLRRTRRRREVVLDSASLPAAVNRNDGPVDRAALERALNTLPDSLRIVFVMKEVEGYTHEEIGRELGIAANASEVRLHRARKQLRRLLGGDHD